AIARLWPLVLSAWAGAYLAVLCAAVLTLLNVSPLPGHAPLSLWPLVLVARAHLVSAILLGALVVGVSLATYAAHRMGLVAWRRAFAPYVLERVSRLDPTRYVPRYVAGVYLWRHDANTGVFADEVARARLSAAAKQRPGGAGDVPLGICVYGRPTQGKTRLAWEAMREALPGWTFVRWRHTLRPFDLRALRSKRVVLWLDDLHEFANQNEAVILSDLPRRCAEASIRLVVVATCRDGDGETRACRYLESLLERLTPLRLTNISDEEADQLVAAFAKERVDVSRAAFNRTPGSLLLNLQEYRSERFPRLPDEAKCVLRAIKLLRSAHIFTYPAWRVRRAAIDIFGMPPGAWASAVESVVGAGFVWLPPGRLTRNSELELAAAIYLDAAVPDYLTPNAEPSDDWPWLQESLERRRDGEALLHLGGALGEQRGGVGPFLPTDPYAIKLAAVTCYRGALDVYSRNRTPEEWAVAQANLAAALSRQADVTQGMLRQDLRRQASAAYRAALEIFTQETDPASWALTHYSLADLCQRRASDAVYAGEVEDACVILRQAWRYAERALAFYTERSDSTSYRQVTALRTS
ncbi:MAG: hypothetical protein ACRDHP_01510, partial [Ktedonobacterales bacterium]